MLLDQFEAINDQFKPKHHEAGGETTSVKTSKSSKPVLDAITHEIYRDSFDPKERVLVMVFFTDEILNKEAEALGLMI